MSNIIVTPNMGLTLPIPGQEIGPQYASDNNGAFTTIDGHNHSLGQGVQITPAGININSALSLNGNNLTSTNAVEFVNQSSPLTGAAPYLNTAYFSGGNFYINDGSGNQIKLTASGAVNATSSGISSGSATASFSGGVLVVNSATNTPANIQAGSILIGNNVAGSNFATLAAPNSLAASYQLTLPIALPGANGAMLTSDTAGNLGYTNVDNSTLQITSNLISVKNAGITTTQVAANAITVAQMASPNMVITSSSGAFATTSGSLVPVTNLSATITTSGKPVKISFQSDGSGSPSNIILNQTGTSPGSWAIFRGVTSIASGEIRTGTATGNYANPPGVLGHIDVPAAGTYTYALQIAGSTSSMAVNNTVMVVREL